MRTRQVTAGANRQGAAKAAIVVGEGAGLATQDDEAADVLADRHRNCQQACEMEVVGYVADELAQTVFVLGHERIAGLDRGQKAPGVSVRAVYRLRPQPLDAEAGRLGDVSPAVGGDEVAACEIGPHLACDARGQRGHIVGPRSVGV